MAYLFERGATGIYAIACDKTGTTLPRYEGKEAWLLRTELTARDLSMHFPEHIDALSARGFCVLGNRRPQHAA